jgi:translation initiation factor IF-1
MVLTLMLLLIYFRYHFLKMHETTKLNIEKMNEKYRIACCKGRREVKLEPGDLV